jgi:hypothetical protein
VSSSVRSCSGELRLDYTGNFRIDFECGAGVRGQIDVVAEIQEVLLVAEVDAVVHVNYSK